MAQRSREVAFQRTLKIRSRQLRREATPAEAALWEILRDRKVARLKFRRQQLLDRFIADFSCAETKLVIEIDGSIHEERADLDALRQRALEQRDLTFVRFTNVDKWETPKLAIARIVALAGEWRSERL